MQSVSCHCEMSVVSVVSAVGVKCQQSVLSVCNLCEMSVVNVVPAVGVRCQQ